MKSKTRKVRITTYYVFGNVQFELWHVPVRDGSLVTTRVKGYPCPQEAYAAGLRAAKSLGWKVVK